MIIVAAAVGGWFAWAHIQASENAAAALAPNLATVFGPSNLPETAPPKQQAVASRIAVGFAFVINSGDASISLLNVATRQEVRRIPMMREPHHMALTPNHRYLAVGDTMANEMVFLDPVTGEVERRFAVSDPYQFGYSPDGKWLVVNGLLRNQVDILDAATMRLSSRVHVSAMPSHENFSPDSATVYVSLQSSDSVVAIDIRSGKPIWQSVVGPTPAGVLWHNGKLLVGVMGADYVAVLDPVTGRVERRIKTAKGAHVLFVSHDDKLIYVTDRVDGSIIVLDSDTLKEIRRFRIPGGPDDMDFAPDGKVWVTRRWAQTVAVVDSVTGSYDTLPVGRSPHGIWLNTHDQLPTRESNASENSFVSKPGS